MVRLHEILDNIIVYQKSLADTEDNRLSEYIPVKERYIEYKVALSKLDSLYTYTYTVEDLMPFSNNRAQINLMIRPVTGPVSIEQFLTPDQIEVLMENKRKQVVESYIEYNGYYRELMGLPPMIEEYSKVNGVEQLTFSEDESKYYYVTSNDPQLQDVINTPVHTWPKVKREFLKYITISKQDKERLPYLKHITKNIPIEQLRDANYYDIVWYNKSTSDVGIDMQTYIHQYKLIQRYFMANLFNIYDNVRLEFYEKMQIIILLHAALANMIAEYPLYRLNSQTISPEDIYNTFASYGLPRYKFPLKYIREIASKINILTYNKSTNTNLERISTIFNGIDLFKYFLIKQPSGLAPDGSITYDLKFIKTPLSANSPHDYMVNPSNVYDYNEVVARDSKWGDYTRGEYDSIYQLKYKNKYSVEEYIKLKPDLDENEFSWVESKYIGVMNTINLGWNSLKLSYLYTWIITNKDITYNSPDYHLIYQGEDTSVYELFIYLQCLIFYKYGRTPSLPDDLYTTYKVYGLAENVDPVQIKDTLIRIYYPLFEERITNYVFEKVNGEDGDIYKKHEYRTLVNDWLRSHYNEDTTSRSDIMSFQDLNVILNEYFIRRKGSVDSRLLNILTQTKHFSDDVNTELSYKHLYDIDNDKRITINDYKKIYTNNGKGLESYKTDKYGKIFLDTIDFLDATFSTSNDGMFSTYSKFEVTSDVLQMLNDFKGYTTNYRDYEVINTLLTSLTQCSKLTDTFVSKDNVPYNNLLEYLLSLNIANVRFKDNIYRLMDNKATIETAFNVEIASVLGALRDSHIFKPLEHTHADSAYTVLQQVYANNEALKYLEQLIDFYKSYTQDFISSGAIYILDDGNNVIHALDDFKIQTTVKQWDHGKKHIKSGKYSTEFLHKVVSPVIPEGTISVVELLQVYSPELKKYVELKTDGHTVI